MTDNTKANAINDMLRSLSTWLIDRPAYWLLGMMYKIFFNVSTAELFTNATIKNFYSRVQLIIGVFMVFKLAVTILQGIVNPDKFTDKKSGMSSVISRIIFSLVMLVLLVPINIPNAKTEYEIQLNNNGLLFGTLYSLQNRLLSNNTLGRLILGTTDDATTSSNNDSTLTGADKQAAKLEESANIFTSTILKGFLRINLVPEEYRKDPGEGKAEETLNENRMCQDINEDALAIYKRLDADPGQLLDLINVSCNADKNSSWFGEYIYNKAIAGVKRLTGKDRYVFAYIPILPGIVAFVFVFILLGFTVDIAVRAVKLAVLRLIAPIPIISYIDPQQAQKGAFASWVKTLTSTYLDLFIRLAVVYFVIFLIQDMIVNGIVINNGTGMIGILSAIFIWIGLFFFARQAPKFIRDVLGLQGHMGNIGLSAILGGTAMLAGGGGLKGAALGMMQGAEGSLQATNQGKAMPLGQAWSQNRDTMAKIRTGDKDAHGGIIGGAMDHFNYRVRDRAASAIGLSQANVDKAKKDMINAQDALTTAKMQLDRYNAQVQSGVANYDDSVYNSLAGRVAAAQKDYEDKQRTYQKGDDARSKNFGVSDRPIDRWGVSDRTTMAERGEYRRRANSEHGGYMARQADNARTTFSNAHTALHNAGEHIASGNGYFREANYQDYQSTDTLRNERRYPGSSNMGAIDDQDIASRGGSGANGPGGPGGPGAP